MESSSDDMNLAKRSLGDKVSEIIKEKIFSMEFSRGERLIVESLADSLQVSVTPVRDALKKLVASGVVSYIGNTYSVFDPCEQDIQNILAIRKSLEMLSSFQAAQYMDNATLNLLFRSCEENFVIEEPEDLKFMKYDSFFHRTILEGTGNSRLANMLIPIEDQFWLLFLWGHENNFPKSMARKTIEEHYEIAKAIQSRNSKKSALVMGNHIVKGENRLRNVMY
jgi:DNA-binding GntR family transcriptional regulator